MYSKNTTCHRTYVTTTKHVTLKTASTTTISRTTLIPGNTSIYNTGNRESWTAVHCIDIPYKLIKLLASTSIILIPVKTFITYVKTVTTTIPTRVCVPKSSTLTSYSTPRPSSPTSTPTSSIYVITATVYTSPSPSRTPSYSSVYVTARSDAQLESREFPTSLRMIKGCQASTTSVIGGMAGIFLLGVVIYYILSVFFSSSKPALTILYSFKKATIRLNGNDDRHIPEVVEQA